jgi:hypothetical protein
MEGQKSHSDKRTHQDMPPSQSVVHFMLREPLLSFGADLDN